MRQAGALSVLGASFVLSCLVLLSLLANPVWAQAQATDPLAGLPADIVEDPGDSDDDIVNSVGPIAAANCTVSDDATVTVRDADGTEVTLTNNDNVLITASADQITIEGAGADGNIEGISASEQFGEANATVEGTIAGSTGIECDGTDDADDGNGNGEGNGESERPENICQNIIAAVGDINQGQTGAAVAAQYNRETGEDAGAAVARAGNASAAVAQAQGITIAQVNECLNGNVGTDEVATDDKDAVLAATIPDQKVLANTGGPALLLPALGLLLISSVALRNLLRR